MPIPSLPSPYGIGTLGKEAYKFIDFLKKSGLHIWQTLPLLPTGYGNSPYQALCASALNYYFIDLDMLCDEGLLFACELDNEKSDSNERRVDYGRLFFNRIPKLRLAYSRFNKNDEEFQNFIKNADYRDYAVFMSLKVKFSFSEFNLWDSEFKSYNEKTVSEYISQNIDEILFWEWCAFIFLNQWHKLKKYANENGILIMGDMPIYVASDSLERWKYRDELFLLDECGNPSCVAGVPPDAFSSEGQLWGNPLFNWEKMKENGFSWWNKRISFAEELFDLIRIDHFRAFSSFYAIPYGEKNAKQGEWLKGPGIDFFSGKEDSNIVAEDLGEIDDGVRELLLKTGYPGMRVLEFAFDGNEENEHKPSNFIENCFAYTGTHDNPPLLSYIESLDEASLQVFDKDLMKECKKLKISFDNQSNIKRCKSVIRLLFMSKSKAVILPLQDLLFMNEDSRINKPSTTSDKNWSFRFLKTDFTNELSDYIKSLILESGR